MTDTIDEKIKNVMAITFEKAMDDINEDSTPDNIDTWDSLKHMNLIIALEEEFDISIPDEEVGNIISFKLIKLIVNECIEK